MADVALIEERVGRSPERAGQPARAVVSDPGAYLRFNRPKRRHRGAQIDDAATGVAVESRRRAANHLDSAHRFEIQVVERSLAVGQGERHAVAQDADAADAKL